MPDRPLIWLTLWQVVVVLRTGFLKPNSVLVSVHLLLQSFGQKTFWFCWQASFSLNFHSIISSVLFPNVWNLFFPQIVENVNLFPYLNDLECRENQKQETRLRHQQQQLLNTMLTFGNSLYRVIQRDSIL